LRLEAKLGAGMMEYWNVGYRVWNGGIMEKWNNGQWFREEIYGPFSYAST
jgi:hypothetical protein